MQIKSHLHPYEAIHIKTPSRWRDFHLNSIKVPSHPHPSTEICVSALTKSSNEWLKPTRSCLTSIQVLRLALQLYSFGPFYIQPGPAIYV